MGTAIVVASVFAGIIIGRKYEKLRWVARRFLARSKALRRPRLRHVPQQPQGAPVAFPDPRLTLTIVTAGQSNAANYNSGLCKAAQGLPVYAFHEGSVYLAADPMPGCDGVKGSLWPELGNKLASALGRPVLFINGAAGGASIHDWQHSESAIRHALTEQIEKARLLGYEPEWLIWHQGEADCLAATPPKQYRADLEALMHRFIQALPSCRVYLCRASRVTGPKRVITSPCIVAAQEVVASGLDRVLLGIDTDALLEDYRWDNTHFNSAARSLITDSIAAAIVERENPP